MNRTVKLLQAPEVSLALETLDTRERRFVLQVTIGRLSKAAAANDAGFTAPPTGLAVRNAIQVIERHLALRLSIDFDHVAVGLQDAIEMARANGDPGNMINGYREQAKLAGLYVERKEVTHRFKKGFDDETLLEMEEEELDALIEQADAIDLGPSEYARLEEHSGN